MKKVLVLSWCMALAAIILAVFGKLRDESLGYSIYDRPFSFYGVLSKDRLPNMEEVDEMINNAENIVEVTAGTKIRCESVPVIQSAKVNKVYKGEYIPGEEIEIISENGIKDGMNWGVTNLMEPGRDYLVVLKSESVSVERNHICLYIGPIPLQEGKRAFIDTTRAYTYEELKGVDFFVEDEESYEAVLKIRDHVFQKIEE